MNTRHQLLELRNKTADALKIFETYMEIDAEEGHFMRLTEAELLDYQDIVSDHTVKYYVEYDPEEDRYNLTDNINYSVIVDKAIGVFIMKYILAPARIKLVTVDSFFTFEEEINGTKEPKNRYVVSALMLEGNLKLLIHYLTIIEKRSILMTNVINYYTTTVTSNDGFLICLYYLAREHYSFEGLNLVQLYNNMCAVGGFNLMWFMKIVHCLFNRNDYYKKVFDCYYLFEKFGFTVPEVPADIPRYFIKLSPGCYLENLPYPSRDVEEYLIDCVKRKTKVGMYLQKESTKLMRSLKFKEPHTTQNVIITIKRGVYMFDADVISDRGDTAKILVRALNLALLHLDHGFVLAFGGIDVQNWNIFGGIDVQNWSSKFFDKVVYRTARREVDDEREDELEKNKEIKRKIVRIKRGPFNITKINYTKENIRRFCFFIVRDAEKLQNYKPLVKILETFFKKENLDCERYLRLNENKKACAEKVSMWYLKKMYHPRSRIVQRKTEMYNKLWKSTK